MIRSIAISVWVCGVMAAIAYGALRFDWLSRVGNEAVEPKATKSETVRLRQISVPFFRAGEVAGYVVVKFAAVVVTELARAAPGRIEDYLIDEAYNVIHAMNVGDLDRDRKIQLATATGDIARRVNTRTRSAVVRDLLIEEVAFIDKKDVRK